MATTKTLIVSLMICLVLFVFAVPIVFQITYLNVLLVNYPIHLSEVMVLETFDIQRLEELMRLERTDCVCDELLDKMLRCYIDDGLPTLIR